VAYSRIGINLPVTHTRIVPTKPCVDPYETEIASSDARKAFKGVDKCTVYKNKTNNISANFGYMEAGHLINEAKFFK
jgi:hypothetical protein